MPVILVLLVTVPLLAVAAAAAAPRPVTEVLTAVTGLVTFGLALALVPAVSDHTVTAGHYLRADAVSVVFLQGTAFLYAATGGVLDRLPRGWPGWPPGCSPVDWTPTWRYMLIAVIAVLAVVTAIT